MEVTKLKELCLSMKVQKAKVDELDQAKKEAQKELDKMQGEILEHLKQSELKNFDFGAGKVIMATRMSVKVLDKYKLAEHLKKQERFDDMFTFNYQTINSYYKEQLEVAKENMDLDFAIDGLSEPQAYEYLQVRSK